jgi:dipeptidyl-peptidase 4
MLPPLLKSPSWIVLAALLTVLGAGRGIAQDGQKNAKTTVDREENAKSQEELKLEDLFPEKGIFGPSAHGMAFSHDGAYGAYLYRTYKERRHGSDLHIYDVEKGEVRRITWPSVMAQFQSKTREVVEDRIKKAKEEEKKTKEGDAKEDGEGKDKTDKTESQKKDEEKQQEGEPACGQNDQGEKTEKEEEEEEEEGEREEQDESKVDQEDDKKEKDEEETLKKRGDWVGDKDADDEKAPRYNGISSFKWSPVSREILFQSGGDIYRYDCADDKITRVTYARERIWQVEWLPDGSGYTFSRDGALMRKVFGCDVTRRLDPEFPNKDELADFCLSPDGTRIAFVTRRQIKSPEPRKVAIARYRDRLMEPREVSRRVSDDPLPVYEQRIYLYELSGESDEKDELTEVFKCETHMPDDMLRCPIWSPDSKKIAFMVFEQDPGLVRIFEAKVPEKKEKDEKDEKDKKEQAREIYRFMHTGGPSTPRMIVLHYLSDNKRLVYLSEQTGFRHLHVLDPLYESSTALTSGRYEVYPIDISKDRKWVFVQATREHPSQTDVYKVSTCDGRMVRLTKEIGTHSGAAVSDDGTRVLTNLVSYGQLNELFFIDVEADVTKALTDSHPEKAHKFAEPKPEFFDYENRHGHRLYGMLFKPDDWTESDKRPVLIYFYGGPLGTRKMVVQGSFSPPNYAFSYYMAKKHGYVACTIDTRGSSGYAGVFEKANFGQVGRPQVEDLVDGVKFLVDNYAVDDKRIAIHGWSFGGFQTQMCMYTEPDVFQVGIAGAGPTEWENYNSWYTRHAIGKSEPGEATLKEFSLLPLAKNLKGHLLLVHGMEDANVLFQDTIRVYRELLKAGKETLVELFLDPTGGHGLGGDVKMLSRYRKYEQFLLRTIGRYEPQKDADGQEEPAGEDDEHEQNTDVCPD